MLACLSRRRSWVQIPSGTLFQYDRRTSLKCEWRLNPESACSVENENTWRGTQTAKRRSSNLRDCLWVRLPPVLLKTTCVGWALASLSGCNPPAFELWRFNSVPTHSTTARWSSGRMRDPHSRGMGSIPIRVTQITWPSGGTVDTRRSERRAHRAWEFDSPLGYFLFRERKAESPSQKHSARTISSALVSYVRSNRQRRG